MQPGRAAHPEHLLSHRRLRGPGDPHGLSAAHVDLTGCLCGRVVVRDEGEVAVPGERGLVDGGDGLPVLVVGPLVRRDPAVTGGQERRTAVARGDVEAEGAAGVAAEDGVAAGDERLEGALGLLQGGHSGAEAVDGRFEPVPPGAGDGAVGGDPDLVGLRVDRPGGAGDRGIRAQRLRGGLQRAGAVADLVRHGAGLLDGVHRLRVVGGITHHVDDDPLAARVVVGPREGVAEPGLEPGGEAGDVGRLERLRCRVVGVRLRGVGVGQQERRRSERGDAAHRDDGFALGYAFVTQLWTSWGRGRACAAVRQRAGDALSPVGTQWSGVVFNCLPEHPV